MAVSRRTVAIAAAVAVLVLIAYWLHWRSPAVQVPALFARLQRAVEGGDPGGTLGVLHRDYDIRAHWPVFEEHPGEPRQVALQALFVLYRQHRDDPLRFDCTLGAWKELGDGRIEVPATIVINASKGAPAVGVGAIDGLRFTLARNGWSGRLAIVAHERISLTRY